MYKDLPDWGGLASVDTFRLDEAGVFEMDRSGNLLKVLYFRAMVRGKQNAEQPTCPAHYRISAAMLPAIRSAASWSQSRARWA